MKLFDWFKQKNAANPIKQKEIILYRTDPAQQQMITALEKRNKELENANEELGKQIIEMVNQRTKLHKAYRSAVDDIINKLLPEDK